MTVIVVLLVLAGVAIVLALGVYNGLVRARNETKGAWGQIDVQLKRRYDLVPNLVETVKGYAQHERETLEAVVEARRQAIEISGSVAEQAKAENQLTQTLRSLFALAERYPQLRANENFLALQEELASTENRIAFARQYYNDAVLRYNNRRETFPAVLVAGSLGFAAAEFFEAEAAAEREAPKVSFS